MSEVEKASISVHPQGETDDSTEAQDVVQPLTKRVLEEINYLLDSSSNRTTTPVRKAFVRNDAPGTVSPLAQLVSTRGRGGWVALALYLGLLRRSSAAPYTTNLSARRWALLLNLDDPAVRGARRVSDAMVRLKDLGLVSISPHRGEAATIALLREDGSGRAYTPPGSEVRKGKTAPDAYYLQLPDELWRGHMQAMTAPALAMLLVIAAEPESATRGAWFSVAEFPLRYGISASMRARGTSELLKLGLIAVRKQKVDTPRGGNADERDRVRNLYFLAGAADPSGAGARGALLA